ncbi:MAG: hypothetical protein HZC28_07920 [Spirochaetes bacterium]|nr:hypothetical protein [Spirochaetota bacterium]
MQSIEKIKAALAAMDEDVQKLEVKRVKAAATKVRKAFQEIIKACKEGRLEANTIKEQITAEKAQKQAQ